MTPKITLMLKRDHVTFLNLGTENPNARFYPVTSFNDVKYALFDYILIPELQKWFDDRNIKYSLLDISISDPSGVKNQVFYLGLDDKLAALEFKMLFL